MTFLSALILGSLDGAHCAGMCGELQMAMQAGSPQEVTVRSRKEALTHLLLMNVGPIITYVLAGVVIFLIGLQLFLVKQRPFQFIEPLGAAVWRPVSKLLKHSRNRKANRSSQLSPGASYRVD